MNTFEDDELDVVPVAKATTVTAAAVPATAATPAPSTPKVAPAPEEDLDVDFGDEKITSYSDGLDKVNPEKGKTIRIALATDILKAKAAYTHYIETGEKRGNYRCLRPLNGPAPAQQACCTKLGDNYLYIVVPVVVYTNADSKAALPKDAPLEWKIGFLRIGRGVFRTISDLPSTLQAGEDAEKQEKISVENLDIALTRLTNGKWNVKVLTKKARWRQNPALVEEVKAAYAPFLDGKKLESKLGRKLDVTGWRQLTASLSGTTAEAADLSNVDDL